MKLLRSVMASYRNLTSKNSPDSYKIYLNSEVWLYLIQVISIGALLFTSYIAIKYIQQPLIDIMAFRQTQTALTSYWILKEGFHFAYQTPVAGFPWSIPFEFPIYQIIVAALSYLSGFNLSAVGRFVSYIFLVACAWPSFEISSRLKLDKTIPLVFCALLWTSPLFVYWGRSFMMETTALFFTLACIPYAIDLVKAKGGRRSLFLFLFFATSAILQKSTTAGPVLLFFILSSIAYYLRCGGINLIALKKSLRPVILICIPILIGLAWAYFTDVIKMANLFGSQLTSKALTIWNFGTIPQRFDVATWKLILWDRSIKSNAGGVGARLKLTTCAR